MLKQIARILDQMPPALMCRSVLRHSQQPSLCPMSLILTCFCSLSPFLSLRRRGPTVRPAVHFLKVSPHSPFTGGLKQPRAAVILLGSPPSSPSFLLKIVRQRSFSFTLPARVVSRVVSQSQQPPIFFSFSFARSKFQISNFYPDEDGGGRAKSGAQIWRRS